MAQIAWALSIIPLLILAWIALGFFAAWRQIRRFLDLVNDYNYGRDI